MWACTSYNWSYITLQMAEKVGLPGVKFHPCKSVDLFLPTKNCFLGRKKGRLTFYDS